MKTLPDLQNEARERMEHSLGLTDARIPPYFYQAIDELIASAYNAGKEAVVDYIKQEVGIEPDMSPVNDYVIPFSVLEAARNAE